MNPLRQRRIAFAAAIIGCLAGYAAASPAQTNDPNKATITDAGRYRLWYDNYGSPWCGGTCGGYCCAIVPLIDPVE
jgi:hypothetical protein